MGSARALSRRLGVAACALAAVAVLAGPPAAAAEVANTYGEVTRFGGFDEAAYNNGAYGGTPTEGRFMDVTGFAVDSENETLFVADRTSSPEGVPGPEGSLLTDWRIQELDSSGKVLATATFTLPVFTRAERYRAETVLAGLAVDPHAQRVYALLVGSAPRKFQFEEFSYAKELVAWSTVPQGGGLVAARASGGGELPRDSLAGIPAQDQRGTPGALIAEQATLDPPGAELYAPQGIAVDPLEDGADNPVVIEGSDLSGPTQVASQRGVSGDTLVQQVATAATAGASLGQLLGRWSGASLEAQLEGKSLGPAGIITNPNGSLSVLLDEDNDNAANNTIVVNLASDLSTASILTPLKSNPPVGDMDEGTLILDREPLIPAIKFSASEDIIAGPEVAALTDGQYAADFVYPEVTDEQDGFQGSYWTGVGATLNLGVRLLMPSGKGFISGLHGETIVNTLGNKTQGSPCNLGVPHVALAAGAEGRLWLLEGGPPSDGNPEGLPLGRQIVEFAPGAPAPCPQISGTFTIEPEGGAEQPAGGQPVEVAAGSAIRFYTTSIERHGASPFAYEWDFNAASSQNEKSFQVVQEMVPERYGFPREEVTFTYPQAGEYEVRLTLRSDYGVYTPAAGRIIVKPAAVPQSAFTVTSTPGSQTVSVNGSPSTPGAGSIVDYRWNWGDGGEPEDAGAQSTLASHTYAAPGTYRVTLTVYNSIYQQATSPPQAVTVQLPPPPPPASPLTAAMPNEQPLYELPPAPTAKPPGHLGVRAQLRRGILRVALSCPAGTTPCAGAVRLLVRTRAGAAHPEGRGRRAGGSAGMTLLGQASFRLAPGAAKTVTVRLRATAVRLLRHHPRSPLLLSVVAGALSPPEETLGAAGAGVARRAPRALLSRGGEGV
jgi:hypothetical protein